ncbi:MAG: hypothetical protein VXW00_04985, partial [Candidatus Latescibacterota bacterium]|nr:hypothetical protein [Candidatus Latescibacterota bacterium]
MAHQATEPRIRARRLHAEKRICAPMEPLFVASNHLRDLGKVKALIDAGADLNNSDWGAHWPSE